jgi:hypothetical protein
MRRKLMLLLFPVVALAAAATGLLSPRPAEAACFTYCCPDYPTVCVTCCGGHYCDLNCPAL